MSACVVGALARVDEKSLDEVRDRLSRIEGVTPIDVDRPGKIGLLIEAPSIEEAHATLTGPLAAMDGVLGIRPVGAQTEDAPEGER